MKEGLYTENIWDLITQETKKAKGESYVAVPYFSDKAAQMLPLKKGSLLIVNAEKSTIKLGSTSPFELEKLFDSNVEIHSNAAVHAKIFVVNNTLIVGSSNASQNSAESLKEAVWVSKNKAEISKAIEFIKSLKLHRIGRETLKGLKPIYNTESKATKRNTKIETPYVHVWVIDDDDFSKGFNKAAKLLYQEVESKIIEDDFHSIDRVESETKSDDDILVMQVFKTKYSTFVYPIGKVLGNKAFLTNGSIQYAILLEVPNRRRHVSVKKLSSQFSEVELAFLEKDQVLPQSLAQKFIDFWNK